MWIPIDNIEFETSARASIRDIAIELQMMERSPLSAFDLCEHALLYAYLGLDKSPEDWHEKSLRCLNLAIDRLSTTPRNYVHHGLYGGIAGIGWLIQHTSSILSRIDNGAGNLEDEDVDDPLFDLDTQLLNVHYSEKATAQNYDLVSGFVGIGVYWLERLPRPKAMVGIRQIVEALERTSETGAEGITWFTPPILLPPSQIEHAPLGYYNLGVAHGVPGVIGFLTQVAVSQVDDDTTRKASSLLQGAMGWLFSQKLPQKSISCYSHSNIPGRIPDVTRISWCYGDLGIAAVLQLVGQRSQNPDWISEAENLAAKCVGRKSKIGVNDAPLCHGALGVAHLYNRIFQTSRDNIYRQAVLDWAKKGLALRIPGVGVAGYYAWNASSFPHEQPDASFISGAVGVALALLSMISPIEPEWDRFMLLSGV